MEAKEKTRKRDIIFTVVTLLIFILLAIGHYLLDYDSMFVKNNLRRQGYYVSNVNFEFAGRSEHSGERIYQSSTPIYHEGDYISLWVIKTRFSGWHTFQGYIQRYVEPYQPINEM